MNTLFTLLFLQLLFLFGFSKISNSQIFIDSLYSKVLDENRSFCVYLPVSFDSLKKYPVIYCTDGQKIVEKGYIKRLDSLIISEVIEPVILIGLYSNEKTLGTNTTYRQIEYIKDFQKDSLSQQRFKNHMHFFLKEAPDYILKNYNIKLDSTKLGFYGVSNGGGFGMTLFFDGGYHYKNFICFSPLGCTKRNRIKKHPYPNLYISYGTEELFILVDKYEDLINHLEKNKFNFDSKPYLGGHKDFEWMREFSTAVGKVYQSKE